MKLTDIVRSADVSDQAKITWMVLQLAEEDDEELICEIRGISRATYFRHTQELKRHGFLSGGSLKSDVKTPHQERVSRSYISNTSLGGGIPSQKRDILDRLEEKAHVNGMRKGKPVSRSDMERAWKLSAKIPPKDLQPLGLLGKWHAEFTKTRRHRYIESKHEAGNAMYREMYMLWKEFGGETLSQAIDIFFHDDKLQWCRHTMLSFFNEKVFYRHILDRVTKTNRAKTSTGDSHGRKRVLEK